jgi:hypothetical protein
VQRGTKFDVLSTTRCIDESLVNVHYNDTVKEEIAKMAELCPGGYVGWRSLEKRE